MSRLPLVFSLLILSNCHKGASPSQVANDPCAGSDCMEMAFPSSELASWLADYSHYSALDEGAIAFTSRWGDADFPKDALVLTGKNAGEPSGLFMFVRRRYALAPSSHYHVSFDVDATVDFSQDCAKAVVIMGGASDLEPLPVMSPDYMMRTSITQDPVMTHERLTVGGDVKTSCAAPEPNQVNARTRFAHALPARSAADGSLWVYVGFETSSPEAIRVALKGLKVEIRAADQPEAALEGIELAYSFHTSSQGWQAAFADYPVGQDAFYQLESELRALPKELDAQKSGFYLSGMNRSDDLLMYLWTQIGRAQGLKPGTFYRLDFEVDFASNVPQHCPGAGGAEGESVTLKMGGANRAPKASADPQGLFRLNWDIGSQTHGGSDASAAGHIANQFSCERLDHGDRPYQYVQRRHAHTHGVRTDDQGNLWLFVGTDSGFEAKTSLYYTGVKIKLTPVAKP